MFSPTAPASGSSFTTDWVSVPVPRKSSLSGVAESGVRAPTEHRTSRQLYERWSGWRFLFKCRVVIIILSYDFTSCGRHPSGCACFVLSGTFTFISPPSMEFNSIVFMYPQNCLHLLMCTPITGVAMRGGGGRHYADVICSLLSLNDYRMSSGGLCYPT